MTPIPEEDEAGRHEIEEGEAQQFEAEENPEEGDEIEGGGEVPEDLMKVLIH